MREFEKPPPNSGGVAGCGWWRHGGRHSYGGIAAIFFVFCGIGVGLTRPDPTLTRFSHAKGVSSGSRNGTTRTRRGTPHQHLHHDGELGTPHQHHARDTAPRISAPRMRARTAMTAAATALPSVTEGNWFCFFFSFFVVFVLFFFFYLFSV